MPLRIRTQFQFARMNGLKNLRFQNPIIPCLNESLQETQYMSASILIMLALMTLNTVMLRILKSLRGKYPFLSKYVQDAFVPTLLGSTLNHLKANKFFRNNRRIDSSSWNVSRGSQSNP